MKNITKIKCGNSWEKKGKILLSLYVGRDKSHRKRVQENKEGKVGTGADNKIWFFRENIILVRGVHFGTPSNSGLIKQYTSVNIVGHKIKLKMVPWMLRSYHSKKQNYMKFFSKFNDIIFYFDSLSRFIYNLFRSHSRVIDFFFFKFTPEF